MILGWGVFHLVDGIIDHEILGIHQAYEYGNHLPWDMAFLASGVVSIPSGGR
jgi:uncharacterized membrane protein